MADPNAALATMIRNLEEKSGKSLEAWVTLAKKQKLAKHGEIMKWLKTEHGLGHGYANLVALESLKGGSVTAAVSGSDDAALLEAQYAGAKAALRPVYDRVASAIAKFGPDVAFAPKKANVSVRRAKQFALLQPSTATRFDVGIQLKGVAPSGRLEASGSFSAMVSHRVRVESAKDIDAELIGWLKQAYEAAK